MPAFTGWLPHSDRTTYQDLAQLMVTDISVLKGPGILPMAITSGRN